MRQMIPDLQQEVLDLRAIASQASTATSPASSNVTMATASPRLAVSHRPVGAPKLNYFKVIEFNGHETHPGVGADWDEFKYQFGVQIQTLETFDFVT